MNNFENLIKKVQLITESGLPFKICGAMKVKNQAQFHPMKYMLGVVEKIEEYGGNIYTNSLVTDVKKDIIYKEKNGEKIPITQSIVSPKVEGAIITAQGANNTSIKASIIQAVEAVTGISSHKIQVFPMVKGE